MQWSPDRNAGFSRADPQRLFLPPIMDPVYGYQAVNVEAQTRDRSSLLNWMKRMLQVRKSSRAFGRGTLRFIRPGNRKVFVYLREYGEDTILCVANLARSAQPVEIDLAPYKGRVPVELLGRTTFPPIGELPYLLTLPGYGFYWFALRADAQPPVWHEERLQREDLPTLVLVDAWKSFFAEQLPAWRSSVAARLRGHLEERVLPDFIGNQRWFAGKGSAITRAGLLDHVAWDSDSGHFLVAVFDVETRHGRAPYFIPLTLVFEDTEETRLTRLQPAAIARVRQQATVGVLADALADEAFCRRLVDAIGEGAQLPTAHGAIRFTPTGAFAELRGDRGADLALSAPRAQGSNTSVRLGDNLFLKAYRHLQPGTSPELEVGRFLTDVARFPNIVPIAGAAEYYDAQGTPHAIALLQAWVQNQGDAWDYTVNYLARFLEDRRSAANVAEASHGLYLEFARTLGRRTAELHGALAMPSADGSFGREEVAREDLEAWRAKVREEAGRTLEQLAQAESLAGDVQELRKALLAKRERLLGLAQTMAPAETCGPKIRLHGDLHLGQVLLQRDDVVFVDFEGEPARSLAERRMKHSPLRDVAGVLRSFDYARHAALRRVPSQPGEDRARWNELTLAWERETREVFLRAYASSARSVGLYESLDACGSLQRLFELEKALYELRYELENRPDWIAIPLASLVEAVR
jgi:maltose alpha-D-glucosyltransferase/alpha-amylase